MGARTDGSQADGSWAGTSWALVGTSAAHPSDGGTGGAGDLVPVPADARDPGLGVVEDEGALRLTVRTGCNSGSATLRVEPGEEGVALLHVGPVVTTRMACLPAAMMLEAEVLGVLAASPLRAETDGDRLRLTGGGRSLVLRRR